MDVDESAGQQADAKGGSGEEEKYELYERDALWGIAEFAKPTLLIQVVVGGFLYGSYAPTVAVTLSDNSFLTWLKAAFIMTSAISCVQCPAIWIGFHVYKGDRHYWGSVPSALLHPLTFFLETVMRKSLPVISALGTSLLNMAVLVLVPGRRIKFAVQFAVIQTVFGLGIWLVGRLLPELLCLMDSVSPLISVAFYPVVASLFELLYLPILFWIWGFRSRRDCPDLALHFLVTVVHGLSEAIYFGGLLQMAVRYTDAQLPFYALFSIFSRCASKLFDRLGFFYYLTSCIWPNEMTAHRDLLGRQAHFQSWMCFINVLMMSPNGIGMLAVEAMYGEDFQTVYTRTGFWMVVILAGIISVLTEACIAAVSWWQRRESPVQYTYMQTFLNMHQPGMQPYFTKISEIFGTPADRSFEQSIRAPRNVESVAPFLGLPARHICIANAVVGCYSAGSHAQALARIVQGTGFEMCT